MCASVTGLDTIYRNLHDLLADFYYDGRMTIGKRFIIVVFGPRDKGEHVFYPCPFFPYPYDTMIY